jgi:hypothetical protein
MHKFLMHLMPSSMICHPRHIYMHVVPSTHFRIGLYPISSQVSFKSWGTLWMHECTYTTYDDTLTQFNSWILGYLNLIIPSQVLINISTHHHHSYTYKHTNHIANVILSHVTISSQHTKSSWIINTINIIT